MISLLFLGLGAASAAGPIQLRGALGPGPSAEIVVHRESGKFVFLREFSERTDLVCGLMLEGGPAAVASGRESRTGVLIDLASPGWVRTQVGRSKIALFPDPERADVLDLRLEAPYDPAQLADVVYSGPLAGSLAELLRSGLALEGSAARGPRTFAAHGKLDAAGAFELETASVLVQNLFTDRTPFLTVARGRVVASPGRVKLVTRHGRWLEVVSGPALGNVGLGGRPAMPRDLVPFEVVTVLGLQFGSELRLLRVLAR